MTKKISFALAVALLVNLFNSCRQELLSQENENQKNLKNYKVYTIDKKQITTDFKLFDKVAKVQNIFSQRMEAGKSIQDSVLDGAIIGINKVLVVEENGQKSYTFPLKRIFPNGKIENLVLKRNSDSSFTGILVQYNITEQEKELFNNWHSIDLKSKIKTYNIRKLSIKTNAKQVSQTTNDGCITVNYDDGECTAGGHHHYGGAPCQGNPSQQPRKPHVLSIVQDPDCGDTDGSNGGGDSGGSGSGGSNGGNIGGTVGGNTGGNIGGAGYNPKAGNNPPQSNPDPSNNGNGIDTMPFTDADFNYYNSNDIADPAFQFYGQVSQFVNSQPLNVKNLNALNQYFFYFTYNYLSANGVNPITKAFLSERLQLIANWYYQTNTYNQLAYGNQMSDNDRNTFSFWAYNYLVNHNPTALDYFKNNPQDLELIYMKVSNNESVNYANTTADKILSILIANSQNSVFNSDKKQFFNGLYEYFSDNNGSLETQNFITWALQFKTNNPNTSWIQFKNWFVSNYSENFRSKIIQLSNNELQEYVSINEVILSSTYSEEYIHETNEAFVAFTSFSDIETMTDTQIQTVLNQCCPSIILFPQNFTQEKAKMIEANYRFNRKFYPEWSKSKCFWEASRETIQILLDLGGLVPIIGEVCDITNGIIYTIQGDELNASLSYASAIPIAGWFASGTKFGVKVVNASDVVSRQMLKWIVGTDGFIKFGYSNQLRKVIKLTDATKQAHHIIPWSFHNNPIVQKAAKSSNAFHLNESLNGIAVASWRNQPNHNAYNTRILNKLNSLPSNLTTDQAYNNLIIILNQAKQAVINNPNTHLNDLIF